MRNVYDVSSDGQRFLVMVESGEARPETIVVVTDWTRRLDSGHRLRPISVPPRGDRR